MCGRNKQVVSWHCQPATGQGTVNLTLACWAIFCNAQHCKPYLIIHLLHFRHLWLPMGVYGKPSKAISGSLFFVATIQQALATLKLYRYAQVPSTHKKKLLSFGCAGLPPWILFAQRTSISKPLPTFTTVINKCQQLVEFSATSTYLLELPRDKKGNNAFESQKKSLTDVLIA